jgi:membrane protease YdiL (CAAX protease family)
LLIAYPNLLALCVARRAWDQWQTFTVGNTALGLGLLIYATRSRLLEAAWGQVTLRGVLLGILAGLVPLAVILVLMFWPGRLGCDIVASGIGAITTRHVVYRLWVQVGLATVLCEEFAFRGVLQVLLLRTLSVPWALGLDAVVFGLWHAALLYNACAGRRGVARLAATGGGTALYTLLGLLLALVRHVAGGLLAAIVAHGVLDVLMFAGMVVRRRQLRLMAVSETV